MRGTKINLNKDKLSGKIKRQSERMSFFLGRAWQNKNWRGLEFMEMRNSLGKVAIPKQSIKQEKMRKPCHVGKLVLKGFWCPRQQHLDAFLVVKGGRHHVGDKLASRILNWVWLDPTFESHAALGLQKNTKLWASRWWNRKRNKKQDIRSRPELCHLI